MKQRIDAVLICLLLFIPLNVFADVAQETLCFDFSKAPVKPLRENIQFPAGKDGAFGDLPAGGGWGAARGRLKLPLSTVLARLREQINIKDPSDSEIKVTHEQRPGYLDFQDVQIDFNPVPLVTVSWKEQWGYVLLRSTLKKPLSVLVAYQKVSGTDHIKRFCGTVMLSAVGAGFTDLYFYEEADATRRSPEAIMKGHFGTMRTMLAPRAQMKEN